MAKKHDKTKAGTVIGSLDKLMKGLSASKDERDWIVEKITQAGPPHKQWQHTLVLSQLQQLISKVEKEKGVKFKAEQGENIIIETPDFNLELPLSMPAQVLETHSSKELVKHLSKGPEHEIAYTTILLQAIEWLTKHAVS